MTDPHGDPIPPATSGYVEQWSQHLDSVEPGTTFRVDRVNDQIGAALRYLTDLSVRPGIIVEVLEQAPFGGPLWLRIDGREQTPRRPVHHGHLRQPGTGYADPDSD